MRHRGKGGICGFCHIIASIGLDDAQNCRGVWMLGSTDLIADAILGGAFWLVMLIVAFIFGKAFLKKIVDIGDSMG